MCIIGNRLEHALSILDSQRLRIYLVSHIYQVSRIYQVSIFTSLAIFQQVSYIYQIGHIYQVSHIYQPSHIYQLSHIYYVSNILNMLVYVPSFEMPVRGTLFFFKHEISLNMYMLHMRINAKMHYPDEACVLCLSLSFGCSPYK